ncbi:MAG: TIGR04084 family radical SAM/SPASM domain-containing protein [Promethearchaeati archaeon SRVP18_Atabeyarchaeia-1]
MLYFTVLTHACNLSCKYCGYVEDCNESAPREIEYNVQDLKNFLAQDPKPSIIFYGGEPLVRQHLLEQIMDSIPAESFLLQTNATELRNLGREYLKKLGAILVSIDGRRETTDRYRGEGVYDKILHNLQGIRQNGFAGDLIARMTASEHTDIFLDVSHLLELKNPEFNHVHWQIDALWDSPPDLRWNNFERWIGESYDPGIERLVRMWGDSLVRHGKVLPILPFTGIMRTLLNGGNAGLRCGAGIDSFAVTTSGEITVCPIAPEWEFARVGSIFQSKPSDLPRRVEVGAPCTSCDILDLCGGRCLFTNKTKLWGEGGFRSVCRSTRAMIAELKQLKGQVVELISRKMISPDEFEYAPYNNGTETIP